MKWEHIIITLLRNTQHKVLTIARKENRPYKITIVINL